MKIVKLMIIVATAGIVLTGCMPSKTQGLNADDIKLVQFEEIAQDKEVAVIETSKGTIKMVLFPEYAPNTVANFKSLVTEGFYDGKKVYGIENDISCFLFGATDDLGKKGKVYNDQKQIDPEVTYNLWHFPGAVSVMGDEKGFISKKIVSDSRLFFVGDVKPTDEILKKMSDYAYPAKIVDAYKEHGGILQYTGAYTVFGHVYEGLDIVNEISSMEVDATTKKPVEEVVINKVFLSTYKDQPAKASSEETTEDKKDEDKKDEEKATEEKTDE